MRRLRQFRYADLVATIAEDPALAREQKEAILYHNAMRVFWGE